MSIFETIRSANHNLFRNKVRTFLTILAIFIGSFTIILNVAINTGVNSFIDDQTESLGGEDYIMIMPQGSINSMNSMLQGAGGEPVEYDPNAKIAAFSKEDLERLGKIDGLNSDDFYVTKNYRIEYITSAYTKKKYNITLGALPPGNFNIPMTAGELPDRNSDEYLIALEPGYPKALGFDSDEAAIGKTVTITIKDPVTDELTTFAAKVVGVQAPGVVAVNGSIISSALDTAIYDAYMKHYPAQIADEVYMIQTRFDNQKYTEAEIKALLESHGFYGITVSDMMGTIRTFFDVIMIVFTIFGGIALLAAAIGIVNTLLMSVEERTREIGLDKALGMSSGKIFINFSAEAIALGFWGSVFGVAVAMVGYLVNNLVHAPGGFLEEFPTFNLFEFTPANVIPIILVIMLIAFVAGTAPASKAAHKNPIDALRYE